MFEGCRRSHHLVRAFWLHAFRTGDVFWHFCRNTYCYPRFQILPRFILVLRVETPGNTSPENPKLIPVRFFPMKLHEFSEKLEGLFTTPFVKGVAEAGSHRITQELKKDLFVIGGTPTFRRAGK